MSDTPRTDALAARRLSPNFSVDEALDHARQLEAANNALLEQIHKVGGSEEKMSGISRIHVQEIGLDVETLLDNAATASQVRELLRDDEGEETVLREAVRLNVAEPLMREVARLRAEIQKINQQQADADAINEAEVARLREATIEECAKVADAHKGIATAQRRRKGIKLDDELEAEELGEDIASEVIGRKIRALKGKP